MTTSTARSRSAPIVISMSQRCRETASNPTRTSTSVVVSALAIENGPGPQVGSSVASALVAGGRPAEAAVAARDAHRVASRLGARSLQRELQLLAERTRLDLVGLRSEDAHQPSDEAGALGLTPREHEVLQLLARGYTNREIAAELVISAKTASVHVSHILRKLNVSTRIEAARIAQRLAPPLAAPED
jgi:DNA-binding NarL/FixJ family response regulator